MASSSGKNSNIEILRIAAMLMIIIGHIIGHNYLLENMRHSLHYFSVSLLQIICYSATNIYILISGYLLCKKTFKVKRVFVLWVQIAFYSLLGFLFGSLFLGQFSLSNLLKAIMPLSGNQYWFATVYLGLYFLMPFLNLLIDRMTHRQFVWCLCLLTVLFSLWRSFIPFAKTLNPEGGNSIIWFVVLYLFGAYLRLYSEEIIRFIKYPLAFAALLFLFSFASKLLIGAISARLGWGTKGTSLFTEFTSFPMLLSAFFILQFATNSSKLITTRKTEKLVNWFSSSTFSVYLIHENRYIKQALWSLLDINKMAKSSFVFCEVLLIAIGVFAACTCADKLLFAPIKTGIEKAKLFVGLQRRINTVFES